MIFDIHIIDKGIYSAVFEIIEQQKNLGHIQIQGQGGTFQVNIKGTFLDHAIQMTHYFKTVQEKTSLCEMTIQEKKGYIFFNKYKENFFKTHYFNEMQYEGHKYTSYSVSLGKIKVYPIYCDDVQIAEVQVPENRNHRNFSFTCYTEDEHSALITVLLTIYNYTRCYLVEDEQYGYTWTYAKTTDKFLLSKYHPEFVKKIKEKI